MKYKLIIALFYNKKKWRSFLDPIVLSLELISSAKKSSILKGNFANFFIFPSDAPKYDIIWTEVCDLIDSFVSEILTFKECSKRVLQVFNTCWTRFGTNRSNFRFQSK